MPAWYPRGMVSAGRIAVLDDLVVDQIAAGEVVERPASVVKELVENALDAGARHIRVEVERGGKDLIRVVDDGCGMTPDEAKLALQRHATSKIRRLDDLVSLATMGFRGEALPSIAAVSHLQLITRTRESDAAVRLRVEAGRLVGVDEVGAPVGTQVEVRELLRNVPARLKFLKGDATETSHVSDAVGRLAMAHPEVHVQLLSGGRRTIDAPPHTSGLERARCLLGARLAGRLHAAAGSENGVEVEAYLAAPELAQSTSRGLQLYVGRRAVRDRGLLHAVVMGYGELVAKGRYPVAVVFVRVPSPTLDVNVHPQKLEVRFSDPQAVYAAVRHTIARAVADAPWLREQIAVGSSPVRMEVIAASAPPATGLARSHARAQERTLLPLSARRPGGGWRVPPAVAPRAAEVPAGAARSGAAPGGAAGAAAAAVGGRGEAAAARARSEARRATVADGGTPAGGRGAAEAGAAPFFGALRYLGQLDKTYLVCEAAGELVLVDQHAAHERVAFQRLRDRYRERSMPVQRLLFPARVELSAAEAAVVDESAGDLAALGFELEPFGGATYAIKAAPAGLRGEAPEQVLRDLLGDLAERGGSRAVTDRVDRLLATIACHSVVRAGDTLSPREAEALLASMDGVDYRAHCPHGRPVLLRISVAEIARRFGRT